MPAKYKEEHFGCQQAKSSDEVNEGQPEKQGENPASSDSRAFEDSEDGVGKDKAA